MASQPNGRHTKAIIVSGASAAVAAITTEAASRFIVAQFPNRPTAPDIAFGLLPHVPQTSYVTLLAIAAVIVLFICDAVLYESARIPEFITVVALMYVLRAVMTVMTPLAQARDVAVLSFPLFSNGLFPSGHVALTLLFIFLVDGRHVRAFRGTSTVLLMVLTVTMLMSRGHYSIDIVGGALLAYFMWREWSDGRLFSVLKRLVVASEPSRPLRCR